MHRGEVDGFVGGNDFKSKMGNFRKNTRYLNLLVEAEGGHIFFEKKKNLEFLYLSLYGYSVQRKQSSKKLLHIPTNRTDRYGVW